MATTLSPPRRRRGAGTAGRVPPSVLGLFLAPFFVPFALFYLLPVAYAAVQSLQGIQRSEGMFGETVRVFVGLAQYGAVLADSEFLASLGRILLFGVVQVPTMLALALGIALLLDSGAVKRQAFFRLAPFAPYAVPGVIAAILWSFFYHPQISPVVAALDAVGLRVDFLGSGLVLFSIANISTWLWTGYNMLVILAGLQAIPEEVYEAARLDGASSLRIALSIKVPMVGQSLVMSTVFSIIGTLQLFTEPTVLQSVAPSVSSTFTPNMMAYALAAGNNYPKAAAMAVLIALLAFALSFGVLKTAQRRFGA